MISDEDIIILYIYIYSKNYDEYYIDWINVFKIYVIILVYYILFFY